MRRISILLAAILLASCATQRRVVYLQDARPGEQVPIADSYQIRIKPLDRLTVVVNSRNPELAAPFNASTSYNSLSGNTTTGTAAGNNALQVRTVDTDGMLQMPLIGAVSCAGKTREELAREIARRIMDGGYISDPTVNIQFADMKISVIGEVARPGQYNIVNDRVSLFDALSMAGDLTIYGVRNEVVVIRENDGVRTTATLDLTSRAIYDSPYFYIQQNDVIYVKPNKYKAQSGEISQNRNFYLSLVGTAISVATLIVTLTR